MRFQVQSATVLLGASLFLAAPAAVNAAVRVTAHAVSGALAATLVDGRLPAGFHEVVWDGVRDDGRDPAAGIYFIRLNGDSREVETRKVVLGR